MLELLDEFREYDQDDTVVCDTIAEKLGAIEVSNILTLFILI